MPMQKEAMHSYGGLIKSQKSGSRSISSHSGLVGDRNKSTYRGSWRIIFETISISRLFSMSFIFDSTCSTLRNSLPSFTQAYKSVITCLHIFPDLPQVHEPLISLPCAVI